MHLREAADVRAPTIAEHLSALDNAQTHRNVSGWDRIVGQRKKARAHEPSRTSDEHFPNHDCIIGEYKRHNRNDERGEDEQGADHMSPIERVSEAARGQKTKERGGETRWS